MNLKITINTGPHSPQPEEWDVLNKYLSFQLREVGDAAALEELIISYTPEVDRPEAMADEHLQKEPIWLTVDESGFMLWLFLDGSDSEG
jgi:hypothetical protein